MACALNSRFSRGNRPGSGFGSGSGPGGHGGQRPTGDDIANRLNLRGELGGERVNVFTLSSLCCAVSLSSSSPIGLCVRFSIHTYATLCVWVVCAGFFCACSIPSCARGSCAPRVAGRVARQSLPPLFSPCSHRVLTLLLLPRPGTPTGTSTAYWNGSVSA